MKAVIFLLLAMSALRAIWEPAAPAITKTRGYFKRIEMDKPLMIASGALVGDAV